MHLWASVAQGHYFPGSPRLIAFNTHTWGSCVFAATTQQRENETGTAAHVAIPELVGSHAHSHT